MKRYHVDTGTIIDNTTGDTLSPTKAKNRLNNYEAEIEILKEDLQGTSLKIQNQNLRDRLTEKDQLLNKTLTVNNNLTRQLRQRDKEIMNIKRTLDDMIANERTHLGHNALVQFREAIQ